MNGNCSCLKLFSVFEVDFVMDVRKTVSSMESGK